MRLRVFLALLFVSSFASAQSVSFDVDREHFDAGTNSLPVRITLANTTANTLTHLRLLFTGARVRDGAGSGWRCVEESSSTTCSLDDGTLAPGASSSLQANVIFPTQPSRVNVDTNVIRVDEAGTQVVTFQRTSLAVYRSFVVTQTGDSGSGSLRAAIEAMNADQTCTSAPCGIDFHIPPSATKTQTIIVRSTLPAITAGDVTIDGATQTRFGGDTNVDGPEIELRGEGANGNGLEFRGQTVEVSDLAVGGFGANGILLTIAPQQNALFRIVRNYLGTDASGSIARPNALRGLMITGGYIDSEIRANVLSGNARSGLWVWTEQSPGFRLSASMTVEGNRVGVQAHSDAPLPNGASGLFFGPTVDGAIVTQNVIAYNADAGVSVARGARLIQARNNRIFHNGVAAIDIGLDGPTPGSANLQISDPEPPVITSARYDAATNTTTITAVTTRLAFGDIEIDFYASETRDHGDYAEGERFLGTATRGTNGQFTFMAHEDLRGRFISGVPFRVINLDGSLLFDTGEFSRALEVR